MTSKTQRLLLGCCLSVAGGVSGSANAGTASSDLAVVAGLKQALTLTCDTALFFGVVAVDVQSFDGGSVVVGPDGSVATDSGALVANGSAPGQCTVSGTHVFDGNRSVILDFAADSVTLEGAAVDGLSTPLYGGAALTVNDLEGEAELTETVVETTIVGTDDGGKKFTIQIGGRLDIPGDINAKSMGGYSGTIEVQVMDTANYNDPDT
ncbi:DUF4402 domain-containing protein [Spiribacter pallidus]|uniref:DUF4402 domain-containing protein n=1 Tax=Spiribacter pallidus TaxID=1987936 RepID=A0ABV3TA81_9GAMM